MSTHRTILVSLLGGALMAASCGGGDGGGSGGCEQVSAGPSRLTIQNNLATGVRAMLPDFAFGADMIAGECNIIGLNAGGSTSIRVELTRCNNTPADSNCDGRLVVPTVFRNVTVPQGGSGTLTVTADLF